ncbi:hypothetical protein PGT21_020280 [Puccinia graminis f. sp. tritici]|uniref:Uncharacterized protein n=1 Tax=Puccinia graminis f. sp. tritici TaxID=56615 RepID=A0A5B0P6Z9_PUCGR|nr:hypothetical protein PGT21_020280 [Puccinia graminis f. sp. tritici]
MHTLLFSQLCLISQLVIWEALIGNGFLHVKASEQLVESQAHDSYITGGRYMPTHTDPWGWERNSRYSWDWDRKKKIEDRWEPMGIESWKRDSLRYYSGVPTTQFVLHVPKPEILPIQESENQLKDLLGRLGDIFTSTFRLKNENSLLVELKEHLSLMNLALDGIYKPDSSSFNLFGTQIPMHEILVNNFIMEWNNMWQKLELNTTSTSKSSVYIEMERIMILFLTESIKHKIGNLKNIKTFLRGTRGKILVLNHMKDIFIEAEQLGRYILTIDFKSTIIQSSAYGELQVLLEVMDPDFWAMIELNYLCQVVEKNNKLVSQYIKETVELLKAKSIQINGTGETKFMPHEVANNSKFEHETLVKKLLEDIQMAKYKDPKIPPGYDYLNLKLLYDIHKLLLNLDMEYASRKFIEKVEMTRNYQCLLLLEDFIRYFSVTANLYLVTRPVEIGCRKSHNPMEIEKAKYRMFISIPEFSARIESSQKLSPMENPKFERIRYNYLDQECTQIWGETFQTSVEMFLKNQKGALLPFFWWKQAHEAYFARLKHFKKTQISSDTDSPILTHIQRITIRTTREFHRNIKALGKKRSHRYLFPTKFLKHLESVPKENSKLNFIFEEYSHSNTKKIGLSFAARSNEVDLKRKIIIEVDDNGPEKKKGKSSTS